MDNDFQNVFVNFELFNFYSNVLKYICETDAYQPFARTVIT